MKIGVISLGCAKNLVDTENLLGLLKSSNQQIVQDSKEAEAIIINTCGFIESAKSEAIETILNYADYKEDNLKKLIVMGCLVKRYKAELEKEMPEVDRFISIDEYDELGSILSETLNVKIANTYGKTDRELSGKPWMAYLKIADGCDNRCSYCAIPNIRGKFHSIKEEEIVKEAENLVQKGVKEIVLIAQDSSRYGYDLDGKLHLSSLLKKLDAIEGIRWIRILYLYPDEIPDDLIETMKTSKHVLPYFDIPVQHGSDTMLKAMHRRGNRKLILERCEKIRAELPEAILRTTLIAGFPGETLEDHQDNLSLLKLAQFDHMGAFTYSKEEDTPAYDMDDNVPEDEKERRKMELMTLQNEIAHNRFLKWIGQETEVLVEGKDPLTQMYIGRNAMYAPDNVDGCVRFHAKSQHQTGEFVRVICTKVSGQNLIGDEVEGDD